MTATGPKRIQLRRTKGWRKPEGAIVVARPTKWGNPFKVHGWARKNAEGWYSPIGSPLGPQGVFIPEPVRIINAAMAVEMYATWIHGRFLLDSEETSWPYVDLARHELRGHDLACWCPLDRPCHADVLLELANREPS